MKEEVERKHQSDATLRWLMALINEDAKQLVELSLQPDPLAGVLRKKLVQLRFQALVRLQEHDLACQLIQQARL